MPQSVGSTLRPTLFLFSAWCGPLARSLGWGWIAVHQHGKFAHCKDVGKVDDRMLPFRCFKRSCIAGYGPRSHKAHLSSPHLIRIKLALRRFRIFQFPQSRCLEPKVKKTIRAFAAALTAVLILILGSLIAVESAVAAPARMAGDFDPSLHKPATGAAHQFAKCTALNQSQLSAESDCRRR